MATIAVLLHFAEDAQIWLVAPTRPVTGHAQANEGAIVASSDNKASNAITERENERISAQFNAFLLPCQHSRNRRSWFCSTK